MRVNEGFISFIDIKYWQAVTQTLRRFIYEGCHLFSALSKLVGLCFNIDSCVFVIVIAIVFTFRSDPTVLVLPNII